MRTKGAKNKPKLISVQLSELNKIFKLDSVIKISAEYGFLFNNDQKIVIDNFNNTKEDNKHIKYKEINLNE